MPAGGVARNGGGSNGGRNLFLGRGDGVVAGKSLRARGAGKLVDGRRNDRGHRQRDAPPPGGSAAIVGQYTGSHTVSSADAAIRDQTPVPLPPWRRLLPLPHPAPRR